MKFLIICTILVVFTAAAPLPADSPAATAALPAAVVDGDFYEPGRFSAQKVELGRMLFFDKILSGNRNIACSTCHHPNHATADAVALSFGEGPSGLGPERRPGSTEQQAVHERIPRNSPGLFNLGAREFTALFHDGRVELDSNGYYDSGFITPAKWKLPPGLDNVLAAQAMFPVTSPAEMAGQKGENAIADAKSLNNAAGPGGIWELLARRLREIAEYVDLFKAAFPDQVRAAEDITYVLAANAIAAFEADAFRADESPFDQFLRGSQHALNAEQMRGLELFYGDAGCASCHSGKFQSDQRFHAIAVPQIGPGKADGFDADYWSRTGLKAFLEDFGRGRVTARAEDNYKFRTPSLRNVELTGPWGHDGAFASLEEAVSHHLDPIASLEAYTLQPGILRSLENGVLETTARGSRLAQTWLSPHRLQGFLARDTWVQEHPVLRQHIAQANELAPRVLENEDVGALVFFLQALTSPSSKRLSHLVPERVPSGLRVED